MFLTAMFLISSVTVTHSAAPPPALAPSPVEIAERALSDARRIGRSDPEEAVVALQAALDVLPPSEPKRVEVLAAIARTIDEGQHDPISALPWWEAAWEASKALGGDADEVSSIGWRLSSFYRSSRRYGDAERLLRERVELAPDSRSRAEGRLALADLIAKHRPDDPEGHAIDREILADPDSSTWDRSSTLTRLAGRAGAVGQHEEAIVLYEQVVELRRREGGDATYDERRLADALAADGRLSDALARAESALSRDEIGLGPDHPELHWTLGMIADLFSRLGRYDDAMATLDRAQAIAWRADGPGSSRSEQVLEARVRLEDRQSRGIDPEEPALFACSCACGAAADPIRERLAVGDYDGARALARELVGDAEREHGQHALETAVVLGQVAEPFQSLDRPFVVAHRERQWQILVMHHGLDHPDTVRLSQRLGSDLSSLGRDEDAMRYREAAVAGWAASGLETSTEWASALTRLAQAQEGQGDHRAATETWARAAVLARASYGEHAPELRGIRLNLARSLNAEARHEEALEILDLQIQAMEARPLEHRARGQFRNELNSTLYAKANTLDKLGRRDEAVAIRETTRELSSKN